MKNVKHLVGYGILVVIALFLLNMILSRKPKSPGGKMPSEGSWTVYGTNGCGWTRKQLALMDSKKVSYNFVDCDSEDCKDATAYPTLVAPDGTKTVGFMDSF